MIDVLTYDDKACSAHMFHKCVINVNVLYFYTRKLDQKYRLLIAKSYQFFSILI